MQFNGYDKLQACCPQCGSFQPDAPQVEAPTIRELPAVEIRQSFERANDAENRKAAVPADTITQMLQNRLAAVEIEILKRKDFEGEAKKLRKMLKAAEKEEARAAKKQTPRNGAKSVDPVVTLKN